MFLLSLVVDGPAEVGHALTHLPASAIWATAYTAYLASLVGYGTWNHLLGRHPATAWIVQGETPNLASGRVPRQSSAAMVRTRSAAGIGRSRCQPSPAHRCRWSASPAAAAACRSGLVTWCTSG